MFTEKNRITLSDSAIKKEITDKNITLLKINLRYPAIKCPKSSKLNLNAVPFYPRMTENLAYFSEKTFPPRALEQISSGSFIPFSAVMTWQNTFLNEKYLSFILDITFADGEGNIKTERKTQIWETKFGTLCRFSHFFPKDRKLPDIDVINEKLFVLTERSFRFFVYENGEYKAYDVPYNEKDKKIIM